jgi:hypothetical protein
MFSCCRAERRLEDKVFSKRERTKAFAQFGKEDSVDDLLE